MYLLTYLLAFLDEESAFENALGYSD